MKRFLGLTCLMAVVTLFVACSSQQEHKFVGKFTDEFGNKFELRPDYSATITIIGAEPKETRWSNGNNHELPYATIEYNGDPAYYYMRDGALYRHRENMVDGKMAIKITWEEE